MRVRPLVVAAALAAGVLVPAVPAVAAAAAPAAVVQAKPTSKPVKPTTPVKPTKPVKPAKVVKPTKPVKPTTPVKPAKAVKFSASGTVTAVDTAAGTVTVAVKGGTKDVRAKTLTVGVAPTARVTVDEVAGALAEIKVGYRVHVDGTTTGSAYTAAKVNATRPGTPGIPPPTTPSTIEPTAPPTVEPTA